MKTNSRKVKDFGAGIILTFLSVDFLLLIIKSFTNVIVSPIIGSVSNIMFFVGLFIYLTPLMVWYNKKVNKWD